jgi:hypothetical protein
VGLRMRLVEREPNSRMRGPAGLNDVDAWRKFRMDAEFGRLGSQEEEDGIHTPLGMGVEEIDTFRSVFRVVFNY